MKRKHRYSDRNIFDTRKSAVQVKNIKKQIQEEEMKKALKNVTDGRL